VAGGLSQGRLAERIGLEDRSVISKIEHGERRVDGMELARLSEALQVPMRQLLEDPPVQVVSRRNGLVAEETTPAEVADFRVQTELVAWAHDIDQLRDLGVLTVPRLMAYEGAQSDSGHAREAAGWLRSRLGLGDGPIESLLAQAQRAGVLIAVIDLAGDGASMHAGHFAVAVVNRHSDFGRRRSTAAHELGHMVLGDEYTSEIGVHTSKNEREALIDAFASEFLLPRAAVTRARSTLTRADLVALAAEYRVSWTLAIRQAQLAAAVGEEEARDWAAVKPTHTEFMDALGWVPQPDLEKMAVTPLIAHAVTQAHMRKLITAGRAVEIMRGQIRVADLPEIDPGARERW
jgi:Zn-dependent peptidase ImmA (M78 family)/transcriptional regulator with XRE-family HTH domain